MEAFNFSFFSIAGWSIDLDYCDIKWFALETNSDHSVIFEIASKYCISDSLVVHGLSVPSPRGTSLVAQMVKCLPTMWQTWVQSLGQEDLLEKEMATHSSILAWRIPWTDKLQSMGLQIVGHDCATNSTHVGHSFS